MIRRRPDWSTRLAQAVAAKRAEPHRWGANDCALCAADLVAAMTDVDLAAPFRDRYRDQAGADLILAALGHRGLEGFVDTLLPRSDGAVRRGDLVMQPERLGGFLGVYWAARVFGPGPKGLIGTPLLSDAIIWKVG